MHRLPGPDSAAEPLHTVTIPRSFAISTTEVTVAQFRRFLDTWPERRGYRLPTEAEWEYAARAGTTTSRFFGDSDDALGEYAWFARHPQRSKDDPVDPTDPQRTNRVGSLKPNPLGLFDIYGNVWEWTQDRVERFQTADVTEDREDSVLRVTDRNARTRRGGSFPYGAAFQRSATRGTVGSFPNVRRDNVGFRIASTIARSPDRSRR